MTVFVYAENFFLHWLGGSQLDIPNKLYSFRAPKTHLLTEISQNRHDFIESYAINIWLVQKICPANGRGQYPSTQPPWFRSCGSIITDVQRTGQCTEDSTSSRGQRFVVTILWHHQCVYNLIYHGIMKLGCWWHSGSARVSLYCD